MTVRTIAARAEIDAEAADIYAFLERLPNHWRLAGRRIDVRALADNGGVVVLRGPLGLRRECTIELLACDGIGRIEGRAIAGPGTRARVRWEVEPAGAEGGPARRGSVVGVRIDIEAAGVGDRMLLFAGARPWFRRLLRSTLRRLEQHAAGAAHARSASALVTPLAPSPVAPRTAS